MLWIFNYEKVISLNWGEYYGETIYSSLIVSDDNIGAYPIYAESTVSGKPYSHDSKVVERRRMDYVTIRETS
jgi:hypothetical protein